MSVAIPEREAVTSEVRTSPGGNKTSPTSGGILGKRTELQKHSKERLDRWRKSSSGFHREISLEGEIVDERIFALEHFYYMTPIGIRATII